MSAKRTVDEPHSRLTRLANAMADHLDTLPESGDDVRCVIFLSDNEDGGLVIHGYEGESPETAAVADVFEHLAAIYEATGKRLMVVTVGSEGVTG